MPSWRLSALSSGTSAKSGLALLPVPAADARAYQSRGRVYGYPGTRRIPSPSPVPVTGNERAAMANYGPASGGMTLPATETPFWYPGLYWTNSHEHAPVSVRSDNQMPVPAIDPRGLPPGGVGQSPGRGQSTSSYGIVMPGVLMRGRYQVTQPRVTPGWPDWNIRRTTGKDRPRHGG